MIRKLVRGLGPLLISAAMLSPALAQGVPTVDLTSIAKIGEVLTEAKLQVKEMIASNLKLDEQILKQIEQIATLKAQLDALAAGKKPHNFLSFEGLDRLQIGQLKLALQTVETFGRFLEQHFQLGGMR